MAVSIAATPSLRGLMALLFAAALNPSFAAAEGATKGRDYVRVGADQMHQLEVVKVASQTFLEQRSAIGQIAFNEDASTIVLTPISSPVTRLTANVCNQAKRAEPLPTTDSPEQDAPQTEPIA